MSKPTNFPVGTRVRSFDFPSTRTCYIEGVVTAVDVRREYYSVVVTRRVIADKDLDVRPGETVYPPFNGLDGTFGKTSGVELATENEHIEGVNVQFL